MIDKEALETLFRSHYREMYRLAMTLLHDEAESKDVVADVFARMAEADRAEGRGYLLAAVRNRCLNLLEHKSVRARFEQAYTMETEPSLQPTDDDDRLKRLLAYAEQNLTEQTLRVFRMRHLQGMKDQEIADQLGISRVMVYRHLAQAMGKIREYMNVKR